MSPTPALPQNLLVVHIAGISQTMLALPALHALRAHLPQAHITAASSSTAAELIELANVANTVLPVGRLRRAEWLRPRAAIDYRPETLCAKQMVEAESLGARIHYFRALRTMAASATARQRLKDLLAGKRTIAGVEIKPLDRWRIIAALLAQQDSEAETLLAAETARDTTDDGRKQAYITNAALPQQKRERKIFFVLAWLNAFIGGQHSPPALGEVHRFLRAAKPEPDLQLKVLEVSDELARTVKIRKTFER